MMAVDRTRPRGLSSSLAASHALLEPADALGGVRVATVRGHEAFIGGGGIRGTRGVHRLGMMGRLLLRRADAGGRVANAAA